jgi:hypothetical protein
LIVNKISLSHSLSFTCSGVLGEREGGQRNISDMFRYRRAEIYQGLRCRVGLAAAKSAALQIN